jgi:hypothetical protein
MDDTFELRITLKEMDRQQTLDVPNPNGAISTSASQGARVDPCEIDDHLFVAN